MCFVRGLSCRLCAYEEGPSTICIVVGKTTSLSFCWPQSIFESSAQIIHDQTSALNRIVAPFGCKVASQFFHDIKKNLALLKARFWCVVGDGADARGGALYYKPRHHTDDEACVVWLVGEGTSYGTVLPSSGHGVPFQGSPTRLVQNFSGPRTLVMVYQRLLPALVRLRALCVFQL